tara:strand:- start:357 stop:710 length:354 start_codon:yes stop_codon:yes gene_type:complete
MSTPVWSEEQPKDADIKNTFDPTDILQHYLDPYIPRDFINKYKPDIEIEGRVDVKKLRNLYWYNESENFNMYTDVRDLDSLGMNYSTDNTNSSLFLDDDGDFQLNWSFKKTFDWNKK